MSADDRYALDRIFHALRAAPGGERLSLFPHEYTDDEIADPAVGCDKPLTEAEVAYNYNDGPVACAACKPTPEEEKCVRRDCLEGKNGRCEDRCGLAARCFPSHFQNSENWGAGCCVL